ncbi:uncharacterized protein LOC116416503 [Nasonia vitripennis]|uniref:Uncharacterized protein n=1 Tax=Nasonia vitripennis TaxID=7425 RepID=A0A7M7Q334_NASVI|nr:uncharacterized protein LOC116416503 [Nasonia vitripennis]
MKSKNLQKVSLPIKKNTPTCTITSASISSSTQEQENTTQVYSTLLNSPQESAYTTNAAIDKPFDINGLPIFHEFVDHSSTVPDTEVASLELTAISPQLLHSFTDLMDIDLVFSPPRALKDNEESILEKNKDVPMVDNSYEQEKIAEQNVEEGDGEDSEYSEDGEDVKASEDDEACEDGEKYGEDEGGRQEDRRKQDVQVQEEIVQVQDRQRQQATVEANDIHRQEMHPDRRRRAIGNNADKLLQL